MSQPATETKREYSADAKPSYIVPMPSSSSSVVTLKGIQRVVDEVIDFTPAQAEAFMALPRFEGERPVRQPHVRSLIDNIIRETYLPEDVIIKTCVVGSKEYRINGQHTAGAILSMEAARNEGDPEPSIPIRRIRYKAKNMEQLRALYASTDRGAPRTVGNQLTAQLVGTDGFEKVNPDILRRLGEGINMFAFDSGHKRREADSNVRASLLSGKYKGLAVAIAAVFSERPSEESLHMRRAAVIGAMFATFDAAPNIARKFWRDIRDGSDLKAASKKGMYNPVLWLRDWLKSTGVSDRGSSVIKKIIPSETMYQMCIKMWNAHRESIMVTKPKVQSTKERPVAK